MRIPPGRIFHLYQWDRNPHFERIIYVVLYEIVYHYYWPFIDFGHSIFCQISTGWLSVIVRCLREIFVAG